LGVRVGRGVDALDMGVFGVWIEVGVLVAVTAVLAESRAVLVGELWFFTFASIAGA
jgi:hypothetical protein